MYPIVFENLYYEKIWGGQGLKRFRENLPKGSIGESWDIACHEHGMSIISNGKLKGKSFKEAINLYGQRLIGNNICTDKFPLLVKLISAEDKLSIQVHPNDDFARKEENQLGKTEAWYVLDAKDEAELIIGTKNCDREIFRQAINNKTIEKYLNVVKVKKGDFFYIESGMIHGICGGVTLVEIQENSDITYRVYDYDRGREIHVDKALEVIDFSLNVENVQKNSVIEKGYSKTNLCHEKYFNIEKYDIDTIAEEESDINKFYLFTCVNGKGKIVSKEDMVNFNTGDSILIPACLGGYSIEGRCEMLKSYVP